MSIRQILTAGVLIGLLAIVSGGKLGADELEIQGPWAYTQQSRGPANPPRYMATTPSAEDGDIWFLLVCGSDVLTASIMSANGFRYELQRPSLRITLWVDESPGLSAWAIPIETRQITIDPRLARYLVPLLLSNAEMVVSIPELSGPPHVYRFSLQPNDRALRNISLHCFHPGS